MMIRRNDGRRLTVAGMVLAFVMLIAEVPCAFACAGEPCTAKPGAYGLEIDAPCADFDVTGDGLCDTVEVATNANTTKVVISVNGIRCYSGPTGLQNAGMFRYVDAQVVVLRNGCTFISLDSCGGAWTHGMGGLFQYRSGAMKCVVPYNKIVPKRYGYWDGLKRLNVSGNKVIVRAGLSMRTTGRIASDFTYVYRSGTLKRLATTVPIKKIYSETSSSANKKFKATKNISAYREKSCKIRKFTIRKGQNVKFQKMYVANKAVHFQVKVGGKTAWIKGSQKGRPPFEGLYMS